MSSDIQQSFEELLKELEELKMNTLQHEERDPDVPALRVPKFWESNTDYNVAWNVLVAAAGTIAHQATKFSLVCSEAAKAEEVSSVCRAILEPAQKLRDAMTVCLYTGTGGALTGTITLGIRAILCCVIDLVKAAQTGDKKALAGLTGRVWEQCEAMKSTAKSNLQATKKEMLQCVLLMKDILQETAEVLESATGAGPSAEEDDPDPFLGRDSYGDVQFESHVRGNEVIILRSCLAYLQIVQEALKLGVRVISKASISNPEELAWAESICTTYHRLNNELSEHGDAVCPPLDLPYLQRLIQALQRTSQDITSSCLSSCPHLVVDAGTGKQLELSQIVNRWEQIHMRRFDDIWKMVNV